MHKRLLAAATLGLDDLPNELLEIIERWINRTRECCFGFGSRLLRA